MNTFTPQLKRSALTGLACWVAAGWMAAPLQANAFDCDTTSQTLCTLAISPDAGGASAAIRAPGTQFELTADASGFHIRGTIELLPHEGAATGYIVNEAELIAEYAESAQPQLGFRRLRGSASVEMGAGLTGDTGFGALTGDASYTRRVDLGLELGSILYTDLDIRHLNPERSCQGRAANDPGFRECPYWFFQYEESAEIATGFGGTDIGLNIGASTGFNTKVVTVFDPADPYLYLGYAQGAMDSISLNIDSTADSTNHESATNVDKGVGVSRLANIPFTYRTDYAMGNLTDEYGMNFSGHLVIESTGIPIVPSGILNMDGHSIWRFPVELDNTPRFGSEFTVGGNGDINLGIPLLADFVEWKMRLGEASTVASASDERVVAAFSGLIDKDFPWKPAALPMSLDIEQEYRATGLFAFNFDEIDATDSFLQIDGSFLFDLTLGQSGSSLGYGLYATGALRTDVDNGVVFVGTHGQGGESSAIHPLLQAQSDLALRMEFKPWQAGSTLMELRGQFQVAGESFQQAGVLRITEQDAYLGFPMRFDPTDVLEAYHDIQDATRAAEEDVTQLNHEVDRLRGVVQAERNAQQADLAAARADVQLAQQQLDRLQSQINGYKSNIRTYKSRIKSKYRWYKKQKWPKRAWAYGKYAAYKSYYNGLIASRYAAIGTTAAAKAVAEVALDVAEGSLAITQAALVVTPIDADPRVATVKLSRDAALAVLNGLQQAMPEIPEIPGTITATAGFTIDGSGITPEARADYCHQGQCTEIRGGQWDRASGLACITLPADNQRVCANVPAEL